MAIIQALLGWQTTSARTCKSGLCGGPHVSVTGGGCCCAAEAARMLDWPRQLSASMGFSDLLLGMRYMSWADHGN